MPLIIGDLKATIHVMPSPTEGTNTAPSGVADPRDDELSRLRALASRRFDAERKIIQRDPDILGGQ